MKITFLFLSLGVFISGCGDRTKAGESKTGEVPVRPEPSAPGLKSSDAVKPAPAASPARRSDATTSAKLTRVAEVIRFSSEMYLKTLLEENLDAQVVSHLLETLNPKPLVIPVTVPQGLVVAVLLQDASETELTVIHPAGEPPDKAPLKVERLKRDQVRALLKSHDPGLDLDTILREGSPLPTHREEAIPSIPINKITDVLKVLLPQTTVLLKDFKKQYLGSTEEELKNAPATRELIYFVKPIRGPDKAVQGVLFMAGPVVTLKNLAQAKPWLYYVYRKPEDPPDAPLRACINNPEKFVGKVKVEEVELDDPAYRVLRLSGPGVRPEYTSRSNLVDIEEYITIFDSRLNRIDDYSDSPELIPGFTTHIRTRLVFQKKPGDATYVIPFRFEMQTSDLDGKLTYRCKLEPAHLILLTAEGLRFQEMNAHVMSLLKVDLPSLSGRLKVVEKKDKESCEKLRPE